MTFRMGHPGSRSHRRGASLAVLLLLAAPALTHCAAVLSGAHTGALSDARGSVDEEMLGAAVSTQLGVRNPSRVERVYRWSPALGRSLLVWVACQGRGDGRACYLAAGAEQGHGQPQVLALEAVGWSVPQVGAAGSDDELVISGMDGRGLWHQLVRYSPEGGGAVTVGRRFYADGM